MSPLESKLVAVLSSSTIEGEAIGAWRQLRKRKPDGDLFDVNASQSRDAVSLQNAAFTTGYAQGRAEGITLGRNAEKRKFDKKIETYVEAKVREWKEQQTISYKATVLFLNGVQRGGEIISELFRLASKLVIWWVFASVIASLLLNS